MEERAEARGANGSAPYASARSPGHRRGHAFIPEPDRDMFSVREGASPKPRIAESFGGRWTEWKWRKMETSQRVTVTEKPLGLGPMGSAAHGWCLCDTVSPLSLCV